MSIISFGLILAANTLKDMVVSEQAILKDLPDKRWTDEEKADAAVKGQMRITALQMAIILMEAEIASMEVDT